MASSSLPVSMWCKPCKGSHDAESGHEGTSSTCLSAMLRCKTRYTIGGSCEMHAIVEIWSGIGGLASGGTGEGGPAGSGETWREARDPAAQTAAGGHAPPGLTFRVSPPRRSVPGAGALTAGGLICLDSLELGSGGGCVGAVISPG